MQPRGTRTADGCWSALGRQSLRGDDHANLADANMRDADIEEAILTGTKLPALFSESRPAVAAG